MEEGLVKSGLLRIKEVQWSMTGRAAGRSLAREQEQEQQVGQGQEEHGAGQP